MNAATALAVVLADEFARCGVTNIVVAPGARSGPLAQALFIQAAQSGQRLHTRFDERAAGFLALGLAKRSRRPVVVVCTSGTATANLHPAVLEASHSHLPLVVLTADRPPEMRGTGASQTTDQTKLFGSAVRLYTEVGTPCLERESTPSANSYWRSLVCRAVASAASGPVHLNVPFPEPLDFTPADDADVRFRGRPAGKPWIEIEPAAPPTLSRCTVTVAAAARGVVVVGDDAEDPAAAAAFAEAVGWPLLAEPQSDARTGPNAITTYRYLLAHPATRARLMPEIVVSVGRPGISREVQALLRDVDEIIVVDPHHDWADPTRSAHRVLRLLPTPEWPAADSSWLRLWRAADQTAQRALDSFLDDSPYSEPRLVRDVLRQLPDDALCVIGSSMPIRDADVTMPQRRGLRVLCNRGLAGIDGTTSTAIGAAIAHQAAGGGNAYAIMGDLTFLHDLTGLVRGPGTAQPDLTIIVINNQGGGIFSLVGHTADALGFDTLFAAPHSVDIASLAAGAGWQHTAVTGPSELTASLSGGGPRIVEIRTDRHVNAKLHQRLSAHIGQALDVEGDRWRSRKLPRNNEARTA
jgi:2-succinyl-5-enolpyruvyl-6-hydroxy-3-cyclohexene-1-carboxylate synthase